MKGFPLTFKFESSFAYRMVFYTNYEGIYPLFFYGINLIEVFKYTYNYAEFEAKEQERIISKIITSNEIYSEYKNKGKIAESVMIPIEKIISAVVETYLETHLFGKKQLSLAEVELKNPSIKHLDKETKDVVVKQTTKFIGYIAYMESLKKIFQTASTISDSMTKKYKLVSTSVRAGKVSNKRTEECLIKDVSISGTTKSIDRNGTVESDKRERSKLIENLFDVEKKDRNLFTINNRVESFKTKQTLVNKNTVDDIPGSRRKDIEPESISVSLNEVDKRVEVDNIREITSINNVYFETTPLQIDNNSTREMEALVLFDKQNQRYVDTTSMEILQNKRQINEAVNEIVIKSVRNTESVNLDAFLNICRKEMTKTNIDQLKLEYKHLEKSPTFELKKSSVLSKGSELISEILYKKINSFSELSGSEAEGYKRFEEEGGGREVNPASRKSFDKGFIDTVLEYYRDLGIVKEKQVDKKRKTKGVFTLDIEAGILRGKYITPIVCLNTINPKYINPVVNVQTEEIKSVSAIVLVNQNKYVDVNFGKRWRFKTGKAFDKIWINPEKTKLLEMAEQRQNLIAKYVARMKQFSDSNTEDLIKYSHKIWQETKIDDFTHQELSVIHSLFKENIQAYELEQALTHVESKYKSKYITPYKEKMTLTVEAHITFKAMLDFILFVEQLMINNRFFYSASRAINAIDDMISVLEEWVTECRPSEDYAEQYFYLVRWYKWWAAGYRSKYLDNTDLNGLIVLGYIRDEMVNYFESRWGKRVVEYGVDNMYVYSKDFSYINRLRGKKHGYLHNTTDKRKMTDEYGISELELPYSMDSES